jgi:hypothetical protein
VRPGTADNTSYGRTVVNRPTERGRDLRMALRDLLLISLAVLALLWLGVVTDAFV